MADPALWALGTADGSGAMGTVGSGPAGLDPTYSVPR